MVDAWPSTLPQALNAGFTEGIGDGLIEYPTDVGPPISRRRSASVTSTLAGQMRMTSAQIAIMRAFVNTTLLGGALPFTFPDLTAGGTILVKFIKGGLPTWQHVGGGIYQASISLMVLP